MTALFVGEIRQGLKGIGMIASSSKEKHGRVIVSFVGKRKDGLGTVLFQCQWWCSQRRQTIGVK